MTQRVRFTHPLYKTFYEADIPVSMTFKEITDMLIEEGFITEKRGGYNYIYKEKLLKSGAPLEDYITKDEEVMEIMIHALLVILL